MKHEMDKDYLEFLTSAEDVPAQLRVPMKKEIQLGFHGQRIMLKFFSYQVLGGLFSLLLCPQFGIGFSTIHINHTLQVSLHGDTLCSITCSMFFFSCALMASTIGMKGEEWWWLYRRRMVALLVLPAVFWGVLMSLRLTMPSISLESQTHPFYLWFAGAAMTQYLWVMGRSRIYRWALASK